MAEPISKLELSTQMQFKDIGSELSGLARAIFFTKDSDGNRKIKSLFEGQMNQGFFNGYARQILQSGTVQLGFWQQFTIENKKT